MHTFFDSPGCCINLNITLNKTDLLATWESLGTVFRSGLENKCVKVRSRDQLKVKKKALFGLMVFSYMAIVGFLQEHESKPKTLSREFYGNLLILYSKVYRSSTGKL